MFFSRWIAACAKSKIVEMNKFIDCILRRVARNASIPVLTTTEINPSVHADIQCTAGTALRMRAAYCFTKKHSGACRLSAVITGLSHSRSWPGLYRPSSLQGGRCPP